MSGSDQELEAFFKKKRVKSKKKAAVKIDDIGKQLEQHTMEEMNPGINLSKDFSKPIKELHGIKSCTEKVAWKVDNDKEPMEVVVPVELPPTKYLPLFKQKVAPVSLNIHSEHMFPSISMADKLAKELAIAEKMEQARLYAEKLEKERIDAELKNAPKKYEPRKTIAVDLRKDGQGDSHQSRSDKPSSTQASGTTSVAWRDDARPAKVQTSSVEAPGAGLESWRDNAHQTKTPSVEASAAIPTSWRSRPAKEILTQVPAEVPAPPAVDKKKDGRYIPPPLRNKQRG